MWCCDVVTTQLRAVLGCGGKKWDWAENMTASLQQQWSPAPRPQSSVLSIPSPDIPANFLYLHQQQAAAHVLGQSLQPGSSIKAVCVYSPRSGGQADTEQESCGSRPLDMSTILSNCAMLCSDSSVIPTFLCPTPNTRGSCFEWHVIVILLIFQYLQSILIACYWRCPATGLCPAVQNMFLMWHILLFSYNCLAACPQCPAILHLAAIALWRYVEAISDGSQLRPSGEVTASRGWTLDHSAVCNVHWHITNHCSYQRFAILINFNHYPCLCSATVNLAFWKQFLTKQISVLWYLHVNILESFYRYKFGEILENWSLSRVTSKCALVNWTRRLGARHHVALFWLRLLILTECLNNLWE